MKLSEWWLDIVTFTGFSAVIDAYTRPEYDDLVRVVELPPGAIVIEESRVEELEAKLEIVKEALMEIALIPPYFENEPRHYKELIAQKALERLK